MIKIIVEGPRAVGKSYLIKRYIEPAIRRASSENFALSMQGINIVEREPNEQS